jgi:flagellar hook assembly protein FlgD
VEYGIGSSPEWWSAISSDINTAVIDGSLLNWNAAGYVPSDINTVTLCLTVKDATSPASTALATIRFMTILNPKVTPSGFSPNGDNANDATTFTAALTLSANWTLSIKNSGGTTVRTFTGSGTSVSQIWDGKNGSGVVVPEGAYTWTLEAVEPGSGVAAVPKTGTVYVDLSKPAAKITAPVTGSTVYDTIQIAGTASDALAFQGFQVDYAYGASPGPGDWKNIAVGSVPVSNGTLANWATNSFRDEILFPNGTVTIRLTVTDKAGNAAVDHVTVTLDNMLINNVSRNRSAIRPAQGESTTVAFTINQAANVKVRIVPQTSPLKGYPDQTPEADAVRTIDLGSLAAGTHSAVWDGRNGAGQIVPDEFYIYVVEARAPSGRFDKFNYYTFPDYWDFYELSVPASATAYNPYKNEFVHFDFQLPTPGYWILRVYGVANGASFDFYPQLNQPMEPNVIQTGFWDGRDPSGKILTGTESIYFYIPHIHSRALKSNYILVKDGRPGVPGVSIKSDPYIAYLSYGQFTRLKYTLEQAANVTVTIKDPQTGAETTLVANQPQSAGSQEIAWDGVSGGKLVPTEGHYTFTVTATHPVTGFSTVRRGNITVYK